MAEFAKPMAVPCKPQAWAAWLVKLAQFGLLWFLAGGRGELGLLPLVTGLIGWCPPYSLLGINTCKAK